MEKSIGAYAWGSVAFLLLCADWLLLLVGVPYCVVVSGDIVPAAIVLLAACACGLAANVAYTKQQHFVRDKQWTT